MKLSEKQLIKRLKEVEIYKQKLKLQEQKLKLSHKLHIQTAISDRKSKKLKLQIQEIERIENENEWMSNHLDNL